MEKYVCLMCGYVYDPELGDDISCIPEGTSFLDLPPDWICPDCGAEKEMFKIKE